MSLIELRVEQPGDEVAIRAVNRRAFGTEQECGIVDALRSNGVALLSLVATLEGRVVGHIMYSPIVVGGAATGAALGPMSVLPEHQRQGIGGRLIAEGRRRLEALRCPFVIVIGHESYYPRFGFVPASTYGITCEWDVADAAFMIQVLDATRMGSVSGPAQYRTEFSIGSG